LGEPYTGLPQQELTQMRNDKAKVKSAKRQRKMPMLEAPLVDAEKASRIRHIVKMKSQQLGLDDAALAELDATVLGLEGDVGQPV